MADKNTTRNKPKKKPEELGSGTVLARMAGVGKRGSAVPRDKH